MYNKHMSRFFGLILVTVASVIGIGFLLHKKNLPAVQSPQEVISPTYTENPQTKLAPPKLTTLPEFSLTPPPAQKTQTREPQKQTAQSFFESITAPFANFFTPAQQPLESTTSEEDAYFTELLKSWHAIGFNKSEFATLPKNSFGRPLTFEELAENLLQGAMQDNLRPSFAAWHDLSEHALAAMETIHASPAMRGTHEAMLAWYSYFSSLTQQFSTAYLSQTEVRTLLAEHKQRSASIPRPKDISEWSWPTFIKTALAQGEGYLHFGGTVSPGETCENGFSVEIIGKKGGLLWIYYITEPLNPYNYHSLDPGVYVLGRASYGTGICIIYPEESSIGEGVIIFWGSAPH